MAAKAEKNTLNDRVYRYFVLKLQRLTDAEIKKDKGLNQILFDKFLFREIDYA